MITIPDFLPKELCEELMAMIDINRRPSTIADENGDNYFRTSETCDLDTQAAPGARTRAAAVRPERHRSRRTASRCRASATKSGQEFKQHTDYFEPSGQDFDKYCSVAGNRTWTFMAYLNDVEAGGATRFKVIDKMFQPQQGRLVGWNNHRARRQPQPRHAPSRDEGAQGPQVRAHQVVSRAVLGMMQLLTGPHKGGCHCGGVRFTARPSRRRDGAPLQLHDLRDEGRADDRRPARPTLRSTQGEDLLTLYTFNTHQAKHRFCSRCGIHCFHQTRSDPDKFGVNAACLDGVSPYDWAEVPVFDGQNHPSDTGGGGGTRE